MKSGFLPVSGGHTIYYEMHGTGRPAIALHGGPGGGIQKNMHRIYDLTKWCVVVFDQRGCGKSTPFASLENNTTWDLVADIETLRELFGFEKWFVSGGSWGTSLALAYAQTHPSHVTGLLLRGVCFTNEESQRWLYQKGGASEVFPEEWVKFVAVLPPSIRDSGWRTIAAYYQKKMRGVHAQRFANAWWGWESAVSFLIPKKDDTTPKQTLALAKLENHYFVHDCWFSKDQLLKGLYKLKNIPITIVHGRYDMVCPVTQAFQVKDALPHAKLFITPDAGHAGAEPGTRKALKRATCAMRSMRSVRSVRNVRSRHHKTHKSR